jgi:metal-responsive CopG/Arc/MetJ family transcriptional regulator
MTRNTTGISVGDDLVEQVDENYIFAGCRSRSEFFREAAREKLQRLNDSE